MSDDYTDPFERMLDHDDAGLDWIEHRENMEIELADRLARMDPRPVKRHKASQSEWSSIREALLPTDCKVCHVKPASHLHHVLSKGQRGDDIRENLLPVCATCHDLIHGRSSWALSQVRDRITENPAMLDYLIRQKGWDWLNRAYPRWDQEAAA